VQVHEYPGATISVFLGPHRLASFTAAGVDRSPDHLERAIVLGRVKAWPGNAGASRAVSVPANLDTACARRPRPSAGRGGETGFKSNKETDQKAQPSVPQGGLKGAMTRPSTVSGLGRQPTKKLTDDELQKDDKLIS
jgi:hypothetical protein